jgi:hypothetical protein
LVDTKRDQAIEERRSLMTADWLIRVHTPAWLRLAGLTAQADRIANLPKITAMAQYPSLRGPLEAVRQNAYAARDAAWYAAWYAARDAAWYAARDAARYAVRYAARDAAWYAVRAAVQRSAVRYAVQRYAARAAACSAAWYAAGASAGAAVEEVARAAARAVSRDAVEEAVRDAVRASAGAAAKKKLAPVVKELQQSALALVERMINL